MAHLWEAHVRVPRLLEHVLVKLMRKLGHVLERRLPHNLVQQALFALAQACDRRSRKAG